MPDPSSPPPAAPKAGQDLSDLDKEALLAKVEELEQRLVTVQEWVVYSIRLVSPPALFFMMLGLVYLFFPDLFAATLTRITSTLILGKFAAAGGQQDFVFWIVVLGTIDVLVGLWMLWNFDLLFKIPYIGPSFARFEAFGRSFLGQHQWVRRTAFLGIIVIVIVPFQGTGAVMGSIVGRMIGMGAVRAFFAIAIGAYSGYALILGGSVAVVHAFEGGLLYGSLLATGVLALLVGVWWRWFRLKRVRVEGEPRVTE